MVTLFPSVKFCRFLQSKLI